VLDAVDLAFGQVWGEGFEPLREPPGARAAEPRATPCVELLVTDREKGRWDVHFAEEIERGGTPFGPAMRGVTPWRAAEARLLARRIDELTRSDGPFAFGEVVVLLRATTHAGVYERALEERGVPTHVLGGRGYWSQQQVGDLHAYLAALANPLDELALHSVLASPLADLSLDALVLLAGAARRSGARWDLWRVLEAVAAQSSGLPSAPDPPKAVASLAAELPAGDAERLCAFVKRFRAQRERAPRVALEVLIDEAVTGSGYDRTVLAMPAGERRMANVRKLMRMAREFEADAGRDLRAFIDFVDEHDLVQEREGQAPLEADDLDAVRLMTIHRAKGLEFPAVCVADLGKAGREDDSALRVTDEGRVGIRLATSAGGSIDSAALAAIRERQKLCDEEEEKRIFHVAVTRAQEHLVLSGATDLEKLPPEAPLEEPMRWLWRALSPGLPELEGRREVHSTYEGRDVVVRCEVLRPGTARDLLPAGDRDPVCREPDPAGLEALQAPVLASVPVPEALPVSRLSYSGLESHRRCGYRFYLERGLRLPTPAELHFGRVGPASGAALDEPLDGLPLPLGGEPLDGLSPLVRGSVVHALLERLDFARPVAPGAAEVASLIERQGQPVREDDVADLVAMVEHFAASPLRERVARAARVRTELPFAFTLDSGARSLLMNGVVDVHASEPAGTLIVDYKSDRLDDRDPGELVESSYVTQRLVYALAALRSGSARVEVAHVFLERPAEPVTACFHSADAPALERRLLERAEGVLAANFAPSPAPHRGLCTGCPGQPALCLWEADRTTAEPPE
jgi:ATP-dependent helicase/nuclease subunit A